MIPIIREIIQQVVGEVLSQRLPQLQQELIERITQEVVLATPVEPERAPEPAEAPATEKLNTAVASIHDFSTQADILRALLDGMVQFCGRVALFVNRAGMLNGWQARGFSENDAVRVFTIDGSKGVVGRALQDKAVLSSGAEDFDFGFITANGAPHDGKAWVLPLVVRDKVPAVVYADAGKDAGTRIDNSALQLLVRVAGTWIEILNARKIGPAAETGSDTGSRQAMVTPPPAPAIAPHSPAPHAAPVSTPTPAFTPAAAPPEPAAPPVPISAAPPAPPAPVAQEAPLSEEDELHRKAKRFAKLLVDEIKLYNPAKVVQGKENRDIYTRLRDDIDKSRSTYDKRYGATVAGQAKYFDAEVVRILADNDVSMMGADFPK